MKYGAIRGVSKPVSRFILGTMIITSDEQDKSSALLDAALALGCNTLDTANVYAGGNSERGIGRWMQERGNRERMVIVSKGCHHNRDRKRVTPFDLASDLYDSLARLKTDYVDVYLLHRDDPDLPVGPMVEAFNEHYAAGRVKAFGGSNWTHQRIQEANEYAEAHGLVPFTVSSPNYGLAEQVLDPWGPGCVTISGPANQEARDWYTQNAMPVLAYSSLARGLFSGRITPENYATEREKLDKACQTAYCHPVNLERLGRAIELAKQKGVNVPQIVLAYLLASPISVFPIVGAATGDELAENMRAFDIELTPREIAWLNLEVE